MSESNTESELNSLINKLLAENLSEEKEIKINEIKNKVHQKRIKENDDVIRVLRARLGISNPLRQSSSYGSKAEILRTAIKQITKDRFTQFDVVGEIERSNPDIKVDKHWVSTALWSLDKSKKLIRTVARGSNQNAAIYEKIGGEHDTTKVQPVGAPNKKVTVPQRRPAFMLGAEKVEK